MTALEDRLAVIDNSKRIGLMTHVVVGYPSVAETIDLVRVMAAAGASIVELQIPFSDPVADGQPIMAANQAALDGGTRLGDCFDVVRQLRSEVEIPLLFVSYYNPVFNFGVENFCRTARAAGASGLLIPDLPIDEEPEEALLAACRTHELHNIRFVTSESPEHRLRMNAEIASGFVYCASRSGTTGDSSELDLQRLGRDLRRVKSHFTVPLAVGFSIRTKEQVRFLSDYAEIAVVGSSIIEILQQSQEPEERRERVGVFVRNLLDW